MVTKTEAAPADGSARNVGAPVETWEARRERVVDKARATAEKLRDVEREQGERRISAGRKVAELEARSGDDVLEEILSGGGAVRIRADGGAVRIRALAGEIAAARSELAVIDRVIASTRTRREEAILAVYQADAGAVLARVADLLAEADRRDERTTGLLTELEAWEECRYAPIQPDRPSTSLALGSVLADGLLPLAGLQVVYVPTPRTQRIRIEADQLATQANALYAKRVGRQGHLEAGSIEDLVDAVMDDEMRIGPTLPELVTWAERAAAAERARLDAIQRRVNVDYARKQGVGKPLRFVVTWRDGEIDPSASRVRPAGD